MKKITATTLIQPTDPIENPYNNTNSCTSNKGKIFPISIRSSIYSLKPFIPFFILSIRGFYISLNIKIILEYSKLTALSLVILSIILETS